VGQTDVSATDGCLGTAWQRGAGPRVTDTQTRAFLPCFKYKQGSYGAGTAAPLIKPKCFNAWLQQETSARLLRCCSISNAPQTPAALLGADGAGSPGVSPQLRHARMPSAEQSQLLFQVFPLLLLHPSTPKLPQAAGPGLGGRVRHSAELQPVPTTGTPSRCPSPPAHHVQACLWGTEYFSMMAVRRSREHFWSRLSWAEDWRLISSEAEFRLGRCEFWKLCQRSFLRGRLAVRAGEPGEGPFPAPRHPLLRGKVRAPRDPSASPGAASAAASRVRSQTSVGGCQGEHEASSRPQRMAPCPRLPWKHQHPLPHAPGSLRLPSAQALCWAAALPGDLARARKLEVTHACRTTTQRCHVKGDVSSARSLTQKIHPNKAELSWGPAKTLPNPVLLRCGSRPAAPVHPAAQKGTRDLPS